MTSVKCFGLFCELIKHFTGPKQKHAPVNNNKNNNNKSTSRNTSSDYPVSIVRNNMCCHVNFLNGATLTLTLVISRNNGDVNSSHYCLLNNNVTQCINEQTRGRVSMSHLLHGASEVCPVKFVLRCDRRC